MPFRLQPTTSPRPPRLVLDFDIEARPLSWIGGDFVSREVTAIAARFVHQKRVHVWLLGKHSMEEMLTGFRELYDQADLVTGHYIRGYDLPNINGAMIEAGVPPLSEKWSHCTKEDLVKSQGVSKSQESLAAMLGVELPKIQMTQADWREANRLSRSGLRKTRQRVVGDVNQHVQMREELVRRGLLGPPKLWKPTRVAMRRVPA